MALRENLFFAAIDKFHKELLHVVFVLDIQLGNVNKYICCCSFHLQLMLQKKNNFAIGSHEINPINRPAFQRFQNVLVLCGLGW